MSPEMGRYTLEDDNAIMAAHVAVDNAHHPAEVAEGRGRYGVINLWSLPGVAVVSVSAIAVPVNELRYFPILVRTPIIVDAVVIEVTAAGGAGSRCRIAIYNADVNWQPTTRVVASAEIAIDAIAVVNTAIAATTLPPGRYVIAYHADDAATLRVVRGVAGGGIISSLIGANAFVIDMYLAAAYAPLPDPGTLWDTVAVGSAPFNNRVFLNILTP